MLFDDSIDDNDNAIYKEPSTMKSSYKHSTNRFGSFSTRNEEATCVANSRKRTNMLVALRESAVTGAQACEKSMEYVAQVSSKGIAEIGAIHCQYEDLFWDHKNECPTNQELQGILLSGVELEGLT